MVVLMILTFYIFIVIHILLPTVTATTPSSSSCSRPGGRTFSDSDIATEWGGKEIGVITFWRDLHRPPLSSWLWKAFLWGWPTTSGTAWRSPSRATSSKSSSTASTSSIAFQIVLRASRMICAFCIIVFFCYLNKFDNYFFATSFQVDISSFSSALSRHFISVASGIWSTAHRVDRSARQSVAFPLQGMCKWVIMSGAASRWRELGVNLFDCLLSICNVRDSLDQLQLQVWEAFWRKASF